ncbi:MAG: hypothetical protein ABFC86_04325 [Rectinema sp.]
MIERRIDFDRVEIMCVELKPSVFGQWIGIEKSSPIFVIPPRYTYANFLHYTPSIIGIRHPKSLIVYDRPSRFTIYRTY